MSLNERMNEARKKNEKRAAIKNNLMRNDRAYRADRLVEAWSRVPEVGEGLKEMPLTEARNVAINLNLQSSYMHRMTEAEVSASFQGFAPKHFGA